MMQWIGDWLREIVLVILLAAFIDLMLPNSTMQRYVKVVISLFVLLTILSPIIQLFKSDLDFVDWQDQAVEMDTIQPLDDIMEKGKKMRMNNEENSIQYVESQMENMMKAELETEFPGKIRKVGVTTEINAEKNTLEIHKVEVTLISDEEQNAEGSSSENSVKSIEPVEPVVIDIKVNPIEDSDSDNSNDQQTDITENQVKNQVSHFLEKNWSVSAKQLLIIYEEKSVE